MGEASENEKLTLGSLFDGIGGFPLAGCYAGIETRWLSEIEPFPVRVTEKRFPNATQLGDVHGINGADIPPVHIVTFGSPCQNLSIAGKRAGLDGEQSSLFFEAVRIIKEMRYATNGQYPKWAVWENVPGALSSNHGEDFRQVLQSLVAIADPGADVPMPESGKWLPAGEIMGNGYSVAWRILDASKGWGVAQRRKRIFAVLHLAGERAGQVLFESEGLSGFAPPGSETGKAAPGSVENGSGTAGVCLNDQGGGRMDVTAGVTGTLRAETHGHPPCVIGASGFCTEHSADSRGIGYKAEESPTLRAGVTPGVAIEYNPTDSRIKLKEDGICQTLTARAGTGGNNVPLTLKIRSGCEGGGKGALIQENKSATLGCNNDQTLFKPKVYGISPDQSGGMLSSNPHSGIYEAQTSRTLDTSGGNPTCLQGGMLVLGEKGMPEHRATVMNVGFFSCEKEATPPLLARDWKDPPVVGTEPEYLVRRLTPLECCRLQGYPDFWCTGLDSPEPTEAEIDRWERVFTAWAAIQGNRKPKTRKQIVKWLQHPNTDAAEYKAYGNSVAVPCVFFVLAGIVWADRKEESV